MEPMGGIADLEGLKAECELSKRIGYDGRTLIHPSHIKIAREHMSQIQKKLNIIQKWSRSLKRQRKMDSLQLPSRTRWLIMRCTKKQKYS